MKSFVARVLPNCTVVGLLVVGVLIIPMACIGRNPPYHYFGGLDLPEWYSVVGFNCAGAVVVAALRFARLISRPLLIFAMIAFAALLVVDGEFFQSFAKEGTL